MTTRGVRIAAAIAATALALTACGGVDESTVTACHQLASAENSIANTTNAYVAAGEPAGGSQAVRDAINNYPVLVSQAADAVAGTEWSESFKMAAEQAVLYQQAMNAGAVDDATAINWRIDLTVDKCRDAGVDMNISEIQTS